MVVWPVYEGEAERRMDGDDPNVRLHTLPHAEQNLFLLKVLWCASTSPLLSPPSLHSTIRAEVRIAMLKSQLNDQDDKILKKEN
jgi:hypothetical protein